MSHARNDFDAAWHQLGAALPRMSEVGGSHAQRDLFDQLLLDAAIKSGRLSAAQQLLEVRRRADPDGVPVNEQLGAVYAHLGLPELAARARARKAATRTRHPSVATLSAGLVSREPA